MTYTVLIADDEPNIVTALQYLMESGGFRVLVARNGQEALQQVGMHLPDLVLLDVMMPVISGYQVCERMRERPQWRHIKIVMLTAKGRDVEVGRGLSAGADLYVTKPFSTRDLLSKVRGLIQGQIEIQSRQGG